MLSYFFPFICLGFYLCIENLLNAFWLDMYYVMCYAQNFQFFLFPEAFASFYIQNTPKILIVLSMLFIIVVDVIVVVSLLITCLFGHILFVSDAFNCDSILCVSMYVLSLLSTAFINYKNDFSYWFILLKVNYVKRYRVAFFSSYINI